MKKTLFILLAFIASFQVVAQDEPTEPVIGLGISRNGINYIATAISPNQAAVHNNGSFAGVATIPTSVTDPFFSSTFSVTSIGSGFNGASGLTAVTIPTSITSIGTSAFANCTGLTTVTVNWTTPVAISASTFQNVTLSAVTLSIPNGTLAAYQAAPVWQNFNLVERIALPVLGQQFTAGGINYKITRATTPYRVEVGLNTGFVGTATIPATVTHLGNQFAVTAVGASAFDSTGLTDVTLPSSVTTIGSEAFAYCTALTGVTLPSFMSSIGTYAFAGCTSLTTFSLPANGITRIQYGTFSGCTALASIAIPNTVTRIDEFAFDFCTALQSITIPIAVTLIGEGAFQGSGLTTMTLPNAVTSIGESAFNNCTALTTVTLPGSVTSMGQFVFSNCAALQTVTVNWSTPLAVNANVFDNLALSSRTLNVPAGTLAAYQAAAVWQDFGTITQVIPAPILGQDFLFGGIRYKITSATVPYTVEVGTNTNFVGAANIPATVIHLGTTFAVTRIGTEAFLNCGGLTAVILPNTLLSIGSRAFENCPGLAAIAIPNGVTTIEQRAFKGCSFLTSITIPNSVTTIEISAFESCIGLTAITLPNNLSVIRNALFYECTGLQSITIPNSVTEIQNSAFAGCTGLTSVVIPNSVITFEISVFARCTSLISVVLPNALTTISSGLFYGCSSLNSVTIPNSVTSIQNTAFQGCSALPSITLPNALTSIGESAFSGCTSLAAIVIPNTVTSIGIIAFADCIALVSVNIPSSVTSIGSVTFSHCTALTSITIPTSVTSIGSHVFEDCTALTSITIPSSVTSIGAYAFLGCTALQTVNVNWATPLPISVDVFYELTLNGRTLNVPSGTAALYDAAPVWTNFNPIVEQVAVTPVTPAFTAIAPICSGTTLTALPTTSTNNITGTWLPALNNTATTTYTFTPTAGQNATTATLEIFVTDLPLAPAISIQSLNMPATLANFNPPPSDTIRWYDGPIGGSPLTANTVVNPNSIYYVTALNQNNCESLRTAVSVSIIPSFNAVAPICSGAFLAALPTTSIDGITGTWSPELNNTATTEYTFTPDNVGMLVTYATLEIVVNTTALPNAAASQNFSAGATLANVVVTGTNLKWYNAMTSGTILQTSTPLVNGTTYYVSQTLNSCESGRVGVTVTTSSCVSPTLSTVTAAPACLGNTITIILSGLIPNTAGVATYTVGNSGLVTQAGTSNANGMFSFTTPAPANLNGLELSITKISTTAGCETNFADKKVTLVVTPLPTLTTVTTSPTCAGSAAMIVLSGLNPNTAGVATYRVGGGPLVTQAGTSDANGTFSFPTNLLPADANGVIIEITKLTTLGGCVTNFTNKRVALVVNRCVRSAKPVSGKENALTDGTATVILYPNPATDLINIEASLGIQSVEILNNIGQRVMTSTQKQINVSDLSSGVYLVRIQDLNNNVETKKVIIK